MLSKKKIALVLVCVFLLGILMPPVRAPIFPILGVGVWSQGEWQEVFIDLLGKDYKVFSKTSGNVGQDVVAWGMFFPHDNGGYMFYFVEENVSGNPKSYVVLLKCSDYKWCDRNFLKKENFLWFYLVTE